MATLTTPSRKPRVLLAASGSVATVKVPELAVRLSDLAEVRVVITKSAGFFLERAKDYHPAFWQQFCDAQERGGVRVIRDEDEWASWKVVGDEVLHIELKDWADIMVVTPMSANTLGKLANGLADNLLTCTARAWIVGKPFLFAPAMNTDMWNHPLTARHLAVLHGLGYTMIPPVEKKLACGVVGKGGLAPVDDILRAADAQLQLLLQLPPQ